MIINGEVNEGPVQVFVDTEASHNYLELWEPKALGVKFTRLEGELKAVNSLVTPVYGRAWNVFVCLGKWKGKVDFLIFNLDDEAVVLGMEFLYKVKPIVVGLGELIITSKGETYNIRLKASKDVGTPRITSL